jgi:hypothetical protein
VVDALVSRTTLKAWGVDVGVRHRQLLSMIAAQVRFGEGGGYAQYACECVVIASERVDNTCM